MTAPARLVLGPGVADYVAARGGMLTLRQSPRHGCCGGTASLPVAEPQAPSHRAGFESWKQAGLTVFAEPSLLSQLPLKVGLEGLFGRRRLFVEDAVVGAGRKG